MCCLIPVMRNLQKLVTVIERNRVILPTLYSFHSNINLCTLRSQELCKQELSNLNMKLCRYYAKSSGKVKKGTPKIKIDENELSRVFDVEKLFSDFKRPVNNLKKTYLEQLSLRTSPNAIGSVRVKYDGELLSVQDLAEIRNKSQKEVILEMGNFPDAIPTVIEAINKSPLGINPSQQGTSIILMIAKVTREHREMVVKGAKTAFHTCRDGIRNVQAKYVKKLDNQEKVTSEDELFRLKSQLTTLGDNHIAEAEELYKIKEKELLATEQ